MVCTVCSLRFSMTVVVWMRMKAVNTIRNWSSTNGFWIHSIAEFWIPMPSILDSTSKNFLDSGIRITLHGATLCSLFSTGVLVWWYLEGEKSSVDKLLIYTVIYFSYCTRSHAKRRIQWNSHSNCFGKTRSRQKKPSLHFCRFYQIVHMLVKVWK